MRKKLLLAVAGAVLLAAAAVIAYVVYKKHEGRDVHGSSSVEFVTTQQKPKAPAPPGLIWPMYRYDAARQGAPTGIPARIKPPFKINWYYGAGSLVEFPPAVAYGRLYFGNAEGTLFGLDATAHRGQNWQVHTHRCAAATPAVANHVVFMSFLNKPPCNATRANLNGEVLAVNADTGKILWRVGMGPTESSPLVVGNLVYVGDWRGKVYALNTRTGATVWSFQTGGAVKDGMAYAGGRIYFGSYDSHVYALNARTGKLIWRGSAQQRLGATGTFYSTPAVAYDRVYIGSTDDKVYSFGATSGKVRWSHSTGGYVYASPSVWNQRILVGSYDGTFYCFDAATGNSCWQFKANGPISGSGVVINGVVYFDTFKGWTYALDARTGKLLWHFRRGKYASVVTDKKWLYLVGYARIFAMAPRS